MVQSQVSHVLSVVTGTYLMGVELGLVDLVLDFRQIEAQMKSLVMGHKLMAQFVSIVDIIQHREVVSTVSYPVLLIPMLTRSSMYIFVSYYSTCAKL